MIVTLTLPSFNTNPPLKINGNIANRRTNPKILELAKQVGTLPPRLITGSRQRVAKLIYTPFVEMHSFRLTLASLGYDSGSPIVVCFASDLFCLEWKHVHTYLLPRLSCLSGSVTPTPTRTHAHTYTCKHAQDHVWTCIYFRLPPLAIMNTVLLVYFCFG